MPSPAPVALDFESFVLQHTSTPSAPPPPPPYQGQSYPQEKICSSSIIPSPTPSKPSSPRRNLALLSFLAFLVLAIYPFVSGAGWEWEDPSASTSSLTSSQPTEPKFFLQISVVDPASPPSSSSPSSPLNDLAAVVPPPPSSFTSHSRSRSRRSFPSFGGSTSESKLKEEGGEEKDASSDSTFPTSFGRWTKEEESALEIPEAVWDVVDHGKFMLMGRPTHHVKAAVEEEEE